MEPEIHEQASKIGACSYAWLSPGPSAASCLFCEAGLLLGNVITGRAEPVTYKGYGHSSASDAWLGRELGILSLIMVSWASESLFEETTVLSDAAAHSLTPQAKAAGLQLASHDGDDFVFDQSGECADFLKGGTVFPSEPDDIADLEWLQRWLHNIKE